MSYETSSPEVSTIGRLIERPRLNELLIDRFDHRLTTIVGVAGSGKTSAVLRSIENNLFDPRGIDIFVALDRASDDPQQLLTQIADAAGLASDPTDTVNELHDLIEGWVWSSAPDEVAVFLDDTHLVSSPDTLACLVELVNRLPRNGHVVTTSRQTVEVPAARLRAHGQLLAITDDDLALDDHELQRLCEARDGGDITGLPRHAATADLQLAAGPEAGADFLREEVLSALEPQRLNHLRRLAVFRELDDDLVLSVTNSEFDAVGVLGRLPLVESRHDGQFRLHALLREALIESQDPRVLIESYTQGAELLRARGDFPQAVRLYLLAGDLAAANETAQDVLLLSGVQQAFPSAAQIRRLLNEVDPGSTLLAIYDATLHSDGRGLQTARRLEAAAARARATGEEMLETLALFRAVQSYMLDGNVGDAVDAHSQRLGELAATVPFATAATAHSRSALAASVGDAAAARELLDNYRHFDNAKPPGMRDGTLPFVMRDHRLCDLGLPEQVGLGLTPDDLADMPPGAEVMTSFAMWLRGDASPEIADVIVTDILAKVFGRQVQQTMISTLGVATTIALAAGSTRVALERSAQTRDIALLGAPRAVALFADIAAASVAADTQSDEVAAALLDPEVTGLGVGAWPQRPHLLAVPLIYVTRPESRATFDRCAFGPSLRVAVAAGQALVALREQNDTSQAAALPWTRRDLLRVHVLPHHLTELACAAHIEDVVSIHDMFDEIPDLERHLRRVVESGQPRLAAHAAELLELRPATAPNSVHALLLGTPELLVDGELVSSPDWPKRSRVRELLAVLVDRQRVERIELLEMLWPGYTDERKTDANLRTHLWKLQNVIEPDRTNQSEPYFIASDGDTLMLRDDVTTDIQEFDELVTTARLLDEAGSPSTALDLYTNALELVRGEYLAGLDAGWATLTRLRIRSQVLSTTCRIAELVGARGEPEAALQWATQARHLDPLSERAARAFVAALQATGDRSAVRSAIAEFEHELTAAGLAPEPATVRAFTRLR
ncbi:MAG: BTAD domain-containing putative transcriptional regulator [Ilumatobacter sp.]